MRVLIVEDEKHLALPLKELLKQKNYDADCVFDGQDGFDYALLGNYDAIILDIMLPKMNGLEVLSRLRQEGISTPVLMLTALSQNSDIITGLDKGADDYLTKPFSSDVLVARLRAITRRKGEQVMLDGALKYGNTSLLPDELMLRNDGERSVSISKKEATVMEYLVRNAPNVCEKESIIINAWGYDAQAQDNNVEVYISFLRKKLKHIKSNCRIETVRGIGYRLEADNV